MREKCLKDNAISHKITRLTNVILVSIMTLWFKTLGTPTLDIQGHGSEL